MAQRDTRHVLRFLVPQVFTGIRALLGAWALFRAIDSDLNQAATLLILGLLTDRLDGWAARKLNVTSRFGCRFDCFSDYVFYTAVPTVLAYRMAGSPASGWLPVFLTIPFLSAVIRHARNIGWSERESCDVTGFPGLPTLVYAYCIVALVFLRREGELSAS